MRGNQTRHFGWKLMKIGRQAILQLSILINMASADLSKVAGVKDMATANTHFTFDLLRLCAAEDKGQNVFFAPYSITTALAMTCLGARGNTADEMKRVLKWSSGIPTSGFGSYLPLLGQSSAGAATAGYLLVAAQRIYVRESLSLKRDFSQATKQHFVSQAVAADFAGNWEAERGKINSWVEEQTRSKIQDLLPPGSVDALTGMVLVQAIYFKGSWKHKFDSKLTRPADFFTPQGPVKVNMMQQEKDLRFGVSEELECRAVELPYASSSSSACSHDLSMLILLPDAQDGLEKLESALTHGALEKLQKDMHSVKVSLKLPRFTVESKLDLKKALTSLGMPQAFTLDADFTAMTDEDLSISDVFHKAVVEVNEEGSEAAAATAVKMMMRCMPIVMPFNADHPFLFFIVDRRADVILFSGRLLTPPTAT